MRRMYESQVGWVQVATDSPARDTVQTLDIIWGQSAFNLALQKHFMEHGVRIDATISRSPILFGRLRSSALLLGLLGIAAGIGPIFGYILSDLPCPAFLGRLAWRLLRHFGPALVLASQVRKRGL